MYAVFPKDENTQYRQVTAAENRTALLRRLHVEVRTA